MESITSCVYLHYKGAGSRRMYDCASVIANWQQAVEQVWRDVEAYVGTTTLTHLSMFCLGSSKHLKSFLFSQSENESTNQVLLQKMIFTKLSSSK